MTAAGGGRNPAVRVDLDALGDGSVYSGLDGGNLFLARNENGQGVQYAVTLDAATLAGDKPNLRKLVGGIQVDCDAAHEGWTDTGSALCDCAIGDWKGSAKILVDLATGAQAWFPLANDEWAWDGAVSATRDRSGVLWLYRGTGDRTAPLAGRTRIGGGWQVYDRIAAGGDVTGDGRPDLLATDKTGVLWLYPGTGNATTPFSARKRIGGGWGVDNEVAAVRNLGCRAQARRSAPDHAVVGVGGDHGHGVGGGNAVRRSRWGGDGRVESDEGKSGDRGGLDERDAKHGRGPSCAMLGVYRSVHDIGKQ
ncbi:hypothetical protein ACFXGT_14480 [Streptomyces sp. NPDC059352]|uniref:hypothetical protein n=1 Tax=Streptomyces sp. NPDC059352 TaxID=3346810 RepID=UPI003690EEB1